MHRLSQRGGDIILDPAASFNMMRHLPVVMPTSCTCLQTNPSNPIPSFHVTKRSPKGLPRFECLYSVLSHSSTF
jgi:hypothetical protein